MDANVLRADYLIVSVLVLNPKYSDKLKTGVYKESLKSKILSQGSSVVVKNTLIDTCKNGKDNAAFENALSSLVDRGILSRNGRLLTWGCDEISPMEYYQNIVSQALSRYKLRRLEKFASNL